MGVKISELPLAVSASSSDKLVLNHLSETNQITLGALMESYLNGAGLVTESGLNDYLSDFVSSGALTEALAGYATGTDIGTYVSEALGGYLSSSDLSSALSDYVSTGALTEALGDYIPGSDIGGYLSEYLSRSDIGSYLDDALSNYLSESDFSSYLSEGLASLGDFLTASDFAAAMSNYLADSGAEVIYNAISQYINA